MIPGLPDLRNYGDLSLLKPQQKYTLLRQLHNAQRAGRHTDVRIGAPQLGLFSWAAPKDLPKENQKRLFIRQPLHTYDYKNFQGQITSKYGRGTVKKLQESPIVVLENTGDKIKFTRADKRNAPVYTMIKTRNNNWIVSLQKENVPPVIKTYSKQHFKSISLEEAADLIDRGAKAYPKLDGTGALAQMGKHGIDVYGINKDKNGNLIRYTDHIGGLRNMQIPKELQGKTFRVQVSGTQGGTPISPNRLSGLLNANLWNSIQERKKRGIYLYMAALALAGQKDDYNKGPVNELVRKLNSPKLIELPQIATREQLQKNLQVMRQGKHPLTQQGVVVQAPGKRPMKAKLLKDYDVQIKDIFPAEVTTSTPRAGGFTYTLPGQDKELGRVGTGFTHETLIDMMNNPQKYKGKLARITAMSQYPSGAYRMPVFQAMRTEGD